MKYDCKGYAFIFENILSWATQNENVRAVILIGSRARTNMNSDEWSDADLIIVARNALEFTKSDSWIHQFGDPVLTFFESAFDGSLERRVLYEGMMDVDFIVNSPEEFSASLESDEMMKILLRGYKALIDKDRWLSVIEDKLHEPTCVDVSDDTIQNEIRDFFYHCVWVTKKLRRGELWTAMNCLNCYMKEKLLGMIEIHTRLNMHIETDTWYRGRFIEKWAPDRVARGLQGCFSDYTDSGIKSALMKQIELYHSLASEVAAARNITYPSAAKERITGWITTTLHSIKKPHIIAKEA